MPVWTVKGGRHGEREERLLSKGLVGGGWDDLPDLSDIQDRSTLHELYERSYPEASQRRVSNHVGQLWSLIHRMQKGELVVLPVKTTGTIAWDADEVLTALTEVYDKMEDETRTKLPLQRFWALVPEAAD